MKNQNEKWILALTLLFESCKPLTFDSLITKEKLEIRNRNISQHTFYCKYVQDNISKGIEVLSFDDWNQTDVRIDQKEILKISDYINKSFE